MIDALYITAEDAIRTKKAGAMVTEGQPVTLDANGELVGATSGSASIYGVSKLDSNQYRDFAFGEFGAFGTGKLTVVTKGVVRIKDSVYSGIEVNTSTTGSTNEQVQLLASPVVWAVNDPVYVTETGLITKVAAGVAFGKVLSWDSVGGWLEIEVDAAAGALAPFGVTGLHL